MEKERAVRCVPVEMLERLKALAERLWNGNNPSSVHLTAILEEFEPDMKTLGQIVEEYETDFASRLSAKDKEHSHREAALKEEILELGARLDGFEKERAALIKKEEELKAGLNERDARLAGFQAKALEDERELNLRYVAKMQELYGRTNTKELDTLAKWEEKNRSLEAKLEALERGYADRAGQFELREKALEEDFKARKAELIKSFDRIRAGLEAKENALAARERALSYWERTGSRGDGGEQ